jgi:H+-transporting ATPase
MFQSHYLPSNWEEHMADASTQAGTPAASGPDLEKIPVEQVLSTLSVKPEQGLSAAEARQRAAKYGPNAIVEKEKSLGEQILGYFTGSMAYVIEAAALVSALLGHWDDFVIIGSLLLSNTGRTARPRTRWPP